MPSPRPWFAAVGLLGTGAGGPRCDFREWSTDRSDSALPVIGKGIDARGGISPLQNCTGRCQWSVGGRSGARLGTPDRHADEPPRSRKERDPLGWAILAEASDRNGAIRLYWCTRSIKTDRCWHGTEAKPADPVLGEP